MKRVGSMPTEARDPASGLPSREEARLDSSSIDLFTKSLLGDGLSFGSTSLAQAVRLTRDARLRIPFKQSGLVYSCIRVNARSVMSTPIQLFTSDRDDAVEAPPGDALVRLLRKPNPLMSGRQMWGLISTYYQLCGGAYLFLNGGSKKLGPIGRNEMPTEVWPISADLVKPIVDEATKLPKEYQYSAGGRTVTYPAHAVAPIFESDPYSLLSGFGPAQAAWRPADHMYRAEVFDDALVENGGQIGGVFTHEDKRLNAKQLEAMRDAVAQNAEKPRNDRKNVILPAGMKFTPTAMSPVDMQAKDLRIMKRDEILAIFGVPKSLLGYTDDVNRANGREIRRIYYENTVVPYLEWLQDALIAFFFPLLPRKYADWTIGFAVGKTPAMREELDAQIERVQKLMACGLTFVEAAEIVGLEHGVKGLEDRRFVSSTLRPIEEIDAANAAAAAGLAAAGGGSPDDEDEDDEEAPAPPEKPKASKQDEPESEDDGRERRVAALIEEEKRLQKHDRRFKKAIRKVFDDYLLAQRKKLRDFLNGDSEVALSRRGGRPWNDLIAAAWGENQERAAAIMEIAVPEGADRWVEVRNISEDELAALVLANEQKWGRELWSALAGPYRDVVADAAKTAQALVGGALIDATDPAVVAFMQMKEVQIVEGPMSVVAENVRRAIVQSMAEVSSTGTLVERVRQAMESIEESLRTMQDQLGTRALMIARTETSAASNAVRSAHWGASGIEEHEWASAGDHIVRAQHRIDGEVRRIGVPFSNGLRYPGDPAGTAANVVNCRCSTLPVI
jgi:HK97 family phage portal protein